jgi:hypothetical protein
MESYVRLGSGHGLLVHLQERPDFDEPALVARDGQAR